MQILKSSQVKFQKYWAMRDYLVSKEQVEYRITVKKKLQNEKEIAKKNLKNRLKNGNIFNSNDFFRTRA